MPDQVSATFLPNVHRAPRTIAVLDLVESVRLIEQDEAGAVARWRQFVTDVSRGLLPSYGGRMVKSLGDGMMLEFESVQPAIQAAIAANQRIESGNEGVPQARQFHLRIGIHAADVIIDELDRYGAGVNLAARLTTLAGPGEIVVSSAVRDHLTQDLNADIEDLGDCFVKHVERPVRAYRVGPPGSLPVVQPALKGADELRPTVAIIPFALRTSAPEHQLLGDALAEEIISALSRSQEFNVVSRLSTSAFRGRSDSPGEIGKILGANYVLSGICDVSGTRVHVDAELADVRTGRVIWAEGLATDLRAVFSGNDELFERIVAEIARAVMAREFERATSQSLPTLESYALLLGAITLMHRLSDSDFDRAKALLAHLAERLPRSPLPLAWLAKWHVLRVVQGWAPDPKQEAQVALTQSERALHADPKSSLALTMSGLVHSYLRKDFDAAELRYKDALATNPNESLAWLFVGTMHAFKGEGSSAAYATERALRLSPLDPMKYFYDSLSASAAIAAGRYGRAIELARRSLRANCTHLSTYRALAIAQSLQGQLKDANRTIKQLLTLEPQFTVRAFLERYPGRDHAPEYSRKLAEALRGAGLPE